MRNAMVIQDRYAMDREANAAGVLLAALNRMCDHGDVDLFTPCIVAEVGRLARLQSAVLAITAVRFSELEQIDMAALLLGNAQQVYQPKTMRHRLVQLPDYVTDLTARVAAEPVTLTRLSYESLRYDLGKAIPCELRAALKGHSDMTHIFRHLRASWMLLKGASLAEIAEALGHFSESSNLAYLHDGLFSD